MIMLLLFIMFYFTIVITYRFLGLLDMDVFSFYILSLYGVCK